MTPALARWPPTLPGVNQSFACVYLLEKTRIFRPEIAKQRPPRKYPSDGHTAKVEFPLFS
ncbi:MAG TPA: hypothetical protein VLQ47_01505 [Rhodoferax sp.]|nr:hypothetical protein [Rhodoferax sp.]